MKPIPNFLAGALLCLALAPAVFAGPGGTYGPTNGYSPTVPRGYGPPGGGFGGEYNRDYHDHFQPKVIVEPNRTIVNPRPGVKIIEEDRFRDGLNNNNRPYFDRDHDHRPDPRPVVVTQPRNPNFRNAIVVHRPSYYNTKSSWYHGDWHDNWKNSVKAHPYAWSGWNGWSGNKGNQGNPNGSSVSSPWRFGYWSYSNPYYATAANGPAYYNYSQPIISTNVTVDATGGYYPNPIGQSTRDQAMQLFAQARQAFFAGDLRTADRNIDQAIAILPSDTVLHEFHALVLFAGRDYNAAAGAVYAVLSTGPGWNWTTMIGLYPSANIYTAQLRQLEDACNANPRSTHPRFLLAYHYLTAGYTDAAAEMYRQVLALNPRDSLSNQLFASLSGQGLNPVAQLQPIDSVSVNNQFLAGNWAATRDDGSSFQLSLRNDGAFRWVYLQNGAQQQLVGNYYIDNGTLVLQQDGQAALVGQIIPVAGNRFVFKLQGSDPSDPGLTFYR